MLHGISLRCTSKSALVLTPIRFPLLGYKGNFRAAQILKSNGLGRLSTLPCGAAAKNIVLTILNVSSYQAIHQSAHPQRMSGFLNFRR